MSKPVFWSKVCRNWCLMLMYDENSELRSFSWSITTSQFIISLYELNVLFLCSTFPSSVQLHQTKNMLSLRGLSQEVSFSGCGDWYIFNTGMSTRFKSGFTSLSLVDIRFLIRLVGESVLLLIDLNRFVQLSLGQHHTISQHQFYPFGCFCNNIMQLNLSTSLPISLLFQCQLIANRCHTLPPTGQVLTSNPHGNSVERWGNCNFHCFGHFLLEWAYFLIIMVWTNQSQVRENQATPHLSHDADTKLMQ